MSYMETLAPYLDDGWSPLYGLRRHGDKCILAPKPEYYDLLTDPGELKNLYDTAVGDALKSREVLVGVLAARTADAPSLSAVVAAAQEPDSEALRRLESLGYVGTVRRSPTDSGQLADPKDMMPVVQAIDAADNLANAGRLNEALAKIEPVVASFPDNPKALLSLGKIYLHLNRLPEAERTFLKANEIRSSARLCILAAQIMLADMRLDEAAKLLEQAETLEPLHGGIFLARGDLLALQRRPDEAIAAYEHARDVDPHRAAAEAQSRIDKLHEIMRLVQPP
jgi:tetratricopeptide (TPR) repeat protein